MGTVTPIQRENEQRKAARELILTKIHEYAKLVNLDKAVAIRELSHAYNFLRD